MYVTGTRGGNILGNDDRNTLRVVIVSFRWSMLIKYSILICNRLILFIF